MNTDGDILVETDSRGRVNLSKFSKGERFLARQEPDGTIVLTPAVVMTQAAADRLSRNPATLEAVSKASLAAEAAHSVRIVDPAHHH